jgi:hypothetical protein
MTQTLDVIREVQKRVKRGEAVACCASPVKRTFTFMTLTEHWELSLHQVRTDLYRPAVPAFAAQVRELIRTAEGRQQLCTEVLEDL